MHLVIFKNIFVIPCTIIFTFALKINRGASNNQWLDAKDSGSDGGAPVAWNVDVFVQAIKDLVRPLLILHN